MRHVTKSHAVEAFRIPTGAKVTLKLTGKELLQAEGGDWLLIGQEPGAPAIALMDDKAFSQAYQPGVLVDVVTRRGARPKGARTQAKASRVRRAVAATVTRGRRSSSSPEQMAEARRLIEGGKSIAATATELDIPYRKVWGWAKANGWEGK